MTTTFHELLTSPPSGRAVPLILDHASFGSARLLHGSPIPWSEPVDCQNYFGQAQGLLRPDVTLVDLGAACAQLLADRPELVEAMGARTRTGYGLKTLLGDDALADAVVGLTRILAETNQQPLVLQLPAPLRWLALTQEAMGQTELAALEPDHGESASMYIADWLRRFGALPVTLLLLDGRRCDVSGLNGLAPEDVSAYAPLVNAAAHYHWGLALRTDDRLELQDCEGAGAVLPASFWVDQPAPEARVLLAEVPQHADPGHVLDRLATLS